MHYEPRPETTGPHRARLGGAYDYALRVDWPACVLRILLVAMAGPSATALAEDADRLVLLDGTILSARVTSIDNAGMIGREGIRQPLRLDGLRSVDRPVATSINPSAAATIELAGGGVLFADGVTVRDERCFVNWALAASEPNSVTTPNAAAKLSFPVDAIRSIRFNSQADSTSFDRALAAPDDDFDRLFVKVDGNVQSIAGLLEQLDEDNAVFQWEGHQQTVACQKLYGIILAQVGGAADHIGHCLVTFQDGSSLWARIRSLRSGRLMLQTSKGLKVTVSWDRIVRIAVCSPHLVFLSDLAPVHAIDQTIVTLPRSWKRDRSVCGRPLKLGGCTFEKGLGTQAGCQLAFDTDGQYDLLVATIGIDHQTGGRGDCEFIVLCDGKEVFRQRVKGTDGPRPLRVQIREVKRVTLIVEPGEDLDLADHADWCDARFIRGPTHHD